MRLEPAIVGPPKCPRIAGAWLSLTLPRTAPCLNSAKHIRIVIVWFVMGILNFSAGVTLSCQWPEVPIENDASQHLFCGTSIGVQDYQTAGGDCVSGVRIRVTDAIKARDVGSEYVVVVLEKGYLPPDPADDKIYYFSRTLVGREAIEKRFPPGTLLWVMARPLGTQTQLDPGPQFWLEASNVDGGHLGRVLEGFPAGSSDILNVEDLKAAFLRCGGHSKQSSENGNATSTELAMFRLYDARRELERLRTATTSEETMAVLTRLARHPLYVYYENFSVLVGMHVQDKEARALLLNLHEE